MQNFYNDLKINNIKIYFDPEFNLAKKLRMRGLPTTIFIDKSGNEFARAIGEIDFNSKKLIELLEKKLIFGKISQNYKNNYCYKL